MHQPEMQTDTAYAMLPRYHTGEPGHPLRVHVLPVRGAPSGQDGEGTHCARNGSLFSLSAPAPLA